jgi:hypothetical protein
MAMKRLQEPPVQCGSSYDKPERGAMAQNRLPGEGSRALEKKMRRIDIALAVAASILSLGLFYLALFPA